MRSTAGTWSLISNGNGGRLTASDAQSGEHFGDAVAMTSGRIVVGAPDWNAPPWGEDDYVGNGTNKQFAFTSLFASASDVKVFVNGALKTFGADYVLSTPVGGVGATVTLNTAPAQDVKVALVATTPERIGLKPAQSEQGRAFVFDLGASLQTWNRTARLTADAGLAEGDALKEGLSGDHFGASVALDATHVVVGAPDHNESVATQAGAAYVFYNLADQGSGNGASWVRGGGLTSSGAVASGKLTAADPAGSDATFPMPDHFGASVAISGGRVVVGIPGFNQTSGNVITHGDIGAFRTFVEGTLPDLRADASFAEAFAGSATSGFGAKSVYDPVSGELFVPALGENRVYVYKNEGLYWRPVQTLTSPESVYITSAGLTAQYYNSSFIGIPIGLTDFPDFNSADGFFASLHTALTRNESAISIPVTSNMVAPGVQADNFAARWTGQINVTQTENVTFYLGSDDGSRLFIDGTQVINNGGEHGFTTLSGTRLLGQGLHNIKVEFFEHGGGAGILLEYQVGALRTLLSTPVGFGKDVAADNRTLVVGAPDTKAYVYSRNPNEETWIVQQALGGTGSFGSSVAVSGNRIVVGAPTAQVLYSSVNQPDSGYSLNLGTAGTVLVYTNTNGVWREDRMLMPYDNNLPTDTSYNNYIYPYSNLAQLAGDVALLGNPQAAYTPTIPGPFGIEIHFNVPASVPGYQAAGLQIFDGGAIQWFGAGSYNLWNYALGFENFGENTVALRLAPRSAALLWDPENSLGFYQENDSYTNFTYYELTGDYRNEMQSLYVYSVDPVYQTQVRDNSFGALDGSGWGSSVDIVGNTIVVGAPGKQRYAVYDLGAADNTHWDVSGAGVQDKPLTPTSYFDPGRAVTQVVLIVRKLILAGTPSNATILEKTKQSGSWVDASPASIARPANTSFCASNATDTYGNRILVGAPDDRSGSGAAYLYPVNGSTVQQTFKPFLYDSRDSDPTKAGIQPLGMAVDTTPPHFGNRPAIVSARNYVVRASAANKLYEYRRAGPAWTPITTAPHNAG